MIAILIGLLAMPQAASADVDDFVFESLDVDYTLTRDADGVSRLAVVETFVAVFPDSKLAGSNEVADTLMVSP